MPRRTEDEIKLAIAAVFTALEADREELAAVERDLERDSSVRRIRDILTGSAMDLTPNEQTLQGYFRTQLERLAIRRVAWWPDPHREIVGTAVRAVGKETLLKCERTDFVYWVPTEDLKPPPRRVVWRDADYCEKYSLPHDTPITGMAVRDEGILTTFVCDRSRQRFQVMTQDLTDA